MLIKFSKGQAWNNAMTGTELSATSAASERPKKKLCACFIRAAPQENDHQNSKQPRRQGPMLLQALDGIHWGRCSSIQHTNLYKFVLIKTQFNKQKRYYGDCRRAYCKHACILVSCVLLTFQAQCQNH